MTLLVDTGALYALADRADPAHARVKAFFDSTDETLVLPQTILPELDFLLSARLGARAELAVLRAVQSGQFRLECLDADDLARSLELIEQYADSKIGLADASIVAIAERLRITRILTLDHRHFRIFRPRHCEAFELLP